MNFRRLLLIGMLAVGSVGGAGAVQAQPAAVQTVIGSGTPASCQTGAAANALDAAVAAGGDITFDCGDDPVEMIVNTNTTDKQVTVDGGGKIILSGEDARQLFFVYGEGDLTQGNTATGDGGGIYVAEGTVALNSTVLVYGNTAVNGAGVVVAGGSLTVTAATLGRTASGEGNIASGNGGGIYNNGGSVTVRYTTLISNQAANGGGVYSMGGPLTLATSSVRSNIATGQGGGVRLVNNTAQFANNTFSNNRADSGGGLYTSGVAYIESSTFYINRADLGGAVFSAGETHVKNTILAGSRDEADVNPSLNCDGPAMISEGRNIIGDNSCVPNPSLVGDLLSTDPLLSPLADNGGPTRSFEPLEGSPAVDAAAAARPSISADRTAHRHGLRHRLH